MIPFWKLKREVYRFFEYGWAAAGLVYEPFLKARHDRWRAALPVPGDLGVPLGRKVAILLAYQPRGIAASTLVTLEHLAAQGYAPLVVSNAPVSAADLARLAPVTWRIVERPNFGYDFGGYRDGLLLLDDWNLRPDRVLIMNDSIWFPIAPGSTLITRLEAATGDIIGGFMHPDTIRRKTGTARAGFLESYLYLINGSALGHPKFRRFWRTFRLSSNKLNAVYRGERGFSRRMRGDGLAVRGLFSPEGLLSALEGQTDDVLRRTLTFAAYTEEDLQGEGAALLQRDPATPGWRQNVLDHVGRTIARRRFNASFPFAAVAVLGMDFLKKSAGPSSGGVPSLHAQMRRQYLLAVEAGDLPPPYAEVLAEIRVREPALA